MSKLSAVIFVFFVFKTCHLIAPIHTSNVLCMFTSSGNSQLVVFMAVANTLIDRGHNVTVITTIPIPEQSQPAHPFRHILLEQSEEDFSNINTSLAKINATRWTKFNAMVIFVRLVNVFRSTQINALMRGRFHEFLDEDNHFDLALIGYHNNDYLVGVASRYQCPIAVVALGAPHGPLNRMVGNPEETTYVQYPLFGKSQPMTFLERLTNFLCALVEPVLQSLSNRLMECIYRRIFTDDFYPKFSELIANISLVLCCSHFSEMPIRPLVPAVVEIGGIQFKEQPDPLPQDIQAILDSSTNGAILLKVGCKPRGTFLAPDKVKIIVKVLSALNQTILWEWGDNLVPSRAGNILFRRGLPHEGILAHKNIKAFITDGRANCILGAQFRGVPMIGMPLYADEPFNVEEMTNNGFGVFVDVHSLTEQSFRKALDSVLNTPFYSAKVKRFSRIYRDRPTTARETAAFWMEYVIRHQGALHMQSPLVRMSFVERWNIDVMVVIAIVLRVFLKLAELMEVLVRKIIRGRLIEK